MAEKIQEKLLILGMGSPNDKKVFDELRIDGKTIDEYFKEKGIKVYHHPSGGYLTTSIPETTENAIKYARDFKGLVEQGHRVACVLYGGSTFAFPEVFAAETNNIPVISVGSDKLAFQNTYPVYGRTAVGVTEDKNLKKGLSLAEKILNLNERYLGGFFVDGNCKSADDVKGMLTRVTGEVVLNTQDVGTHKGLTIALSDNPHYLLDLDKRVELGVFSLEEGCSYEEIINTVKRLQNSIFVGKPVNLALYAAKIKAPGNPSILKKLVDYRLAEAAKYPPRIPITIQHFK